MRYFYDGLEVGDVTNDGVTANDYAQEIADRDHAVGSGGLFHNNSPTGTFVANFDQSYDPVTGYTLQGSGTAYTVADGDTLQSIAAAVWGDPSMWYLIADANGLSSSDALVAGQTLVIPNRATNVHNHTGTFQVYDPNEAIGNVYPANHAPAPKHNANCGVVGEILLAVVAVVVSIYTAGALSGPLASLFSATAATTDAAAAGAAGAVAGAGATGAAAAGAGIAAAGAAVTTGGISLASVAAGVI